MAVSTLLTLFVVPAAYSVLDDVVEWNVERQKSGKGWRQAWTDWRGRRPAPATSGTPAL